MERNLEIIVNGHLVKIQTHDDWKVSLIRGAALGKANYTHIGYDEWELKDSDGHIVTAEFVREAPDRMFLTLRAGIGA